MIFDTRAGRQCQCDAYPFRLRGSTAPGSFGANSGSPDQSDAESFSGIMKTIGGTTQRVLRRAIFNEPDETLRGYNGYAFACAGSGLASTPGAAFTGTRLCTTRKRLDTNAPSVRVALPEGLAPLT